MNTLELGRIISNRRRTLGLDQRSLAEISNLSVHSLSDLESGKGNPTLAIINRLAASLGLEMRLEVRPVHTHLGES
jgi:transcriptional regulator with XRE-family HTH domain